jgi:hypothetical protein
MKMSEYAAGANYINRPTAGESGMAASVAQ